jgi:hypothetical protein
MEDVMVTRMMVTRIVVLSLPLMVLFTGSPASAQSPGKPWCLQAGSGALECAYDSFAECEQARSGNVGTCIRNEGQR